MPTPVTRHYVRRILRDFRLAGVDRDSATRARIKALREELVVIGQEFDRNIRDDVRTVEVGSAAQLAGLPDDYIAAHPPGPDGRIRLTTEYPDVFPVFTYARSDDAAAAAARRVRQPRVSREPGGARPDDRPAARAGSPAGLRVLGGLRRRRQDDRLGGQRVRVHRPRRRRLGGGGAARVRDAAPPEAAGRTRPQRGSTAGRSPTCGSWCGGRTTTSTRRRCGPTSPTSG